MKKILVLITVLSYSLSFSQTEKGRFSFGLSQATFSVTNVKAKIFASESKQTLFTISPSAGYFVANGLIIGASLNSTFSSSEYKSSFSSYDVKFSSYSIGPWVEYFVGNGSKGKPYINLYPSYGFGNSKSTNDAYPQPVKSDFTTITLSGSIGYALFLNDSFYVTILWRIYL